MSYYIPQGYKPFLSPRNVEIAIKEIKFFFEKTFLDILGLQRVTAPVFVRSGLGLNDDLNGIEKPVSFRVSDAGIDVEVVQSLAKWKRVALKRYGFQTGEGIYTDMNAIRPDETIDHLHSFYVDQWDWEKIISPEERTLETLLAAVKGIHKAMYETEKHVCELYPQIEPILPCEIECISSEALLNLYPKLGPKEREAEHARRHKSIFIYGIGGKLSNGEPHDGRAPDYDDWTTPRPDGGFGLNGDILVWHPVLDFALELSSMGIRVNPETLERQLRLRGCEHRKELAFHKSLLNGELPQTMGGGIGQSRLCMFMLRAIHVGEVACGVWPDAMLDAYLKSGIILL